MGDKYRHLRPKLDRSCTRQDRVPKKRYTRKQAQAQAAEQAGYHAYRCDSCGSWHVGRTKAREVAS